MTETSSAEAIVDGLLANVGITPSADERTLLVSLYPMLRQQLGAMHQIDLGDEP